MYWNQLLLTTRLHLAWLTLTWDVLKFCRIKRVMFFYSGLTLTWDVLKSLPRHSGGQCYALININMRCIEMNTVNVMLEAVSRLTLTWDVLKSVYVIRMLNIVIRLTLTWDVLKSYMAI